MEYKFEVIINNSHFSDYSCNLHMTPLVWVHVTIELDKAFKTLF